MVFSFSNQFNGIRGQFGWEETFKHPLVPASQAVHNFCYHHNGHGVLGHNLLNSLTKRPANLIPGSILGVEGGM